DEELVMCPAHAGRVASQVCERCGGPRCHDCWMEGKCAGCGARDVTDERRAGAARMLELRRRDGRTFFTLAVVTFLLMPTAEIIGAVIGYRLERAAGAFGVVCGLSSIGAAYAWAKARGRHGAFALLGWILGPLGALLTFLLAKNCTLCGSRND